jgi:oxygen-independent coproporphyrinogen III oxidase
VNHLRSGPDHMGLYIHIPFCQSKCHYCGFFSKKGSPDQMQQLVQAELTELDRRCMQNQAQTVYIGGGSPTCLPPDLLFMLIQAVTDTQNRVVEFTVECNPGQVTQDLLFKLRTLGVNRISIGAQSFDAMELRALGRTHTPDQINLAVHHARAAGFKNISLDLIFALCGSTQPTWEKTLACALRLEPTHVSAYSLTIEDDTPLAHAVNAGKAAPVNDEQNRAQYEYAINRLERSGLKQYEISNFALEGHECLHNLGYWQNRPFIGIGPAAASYWQDTRTTNLAHVDRYIEAIDHRHSAVSEHIRSDSESILCETAVLNLRTRYGIDIKAFHKTTGQDIMRIFAEPIERYRALGLLAWDQKRLCLTPAALPIADSILCDFASL